MGSAVSPSGVGGLNVGSVTAAVVGSGAVVVPDSVVLVCAPPLLLTVTPEPTSVLDDVVPEILDVTPVVEPEPVGVDSAVEVEPVVADVVAVSVGSLVEVEFDVVVDDDSEDVPVVSASATP